MHFKNILLSMPWGLKGLLLVTLTFFMFACDSNESPYSYYKVIPYLQMEHKDEEGNDGKILSFRIDSLDISSILVYGYAVDPKEWKVYSYEEAKEGIIRNIENQSETREPDFRGELSSDSTLTLGPVDIEKFFLVFCDATPRGERNVLSYGYREASAAIGLNEVSTQLIIQPWQTRETYTSSKWNIVHSKDPLEEEEEEEDDGEEGGDNGDGDGSDPIPGPEPEGEQGKIISVIFLKQNKKAMLI